MPTEGQSLVIPLRSKDDPTNTGVNITINNTENEPDSNTFSLLTIPFEINPFVVLVRYSKLPEAYIIDGALRNEEWRRITEERIFGGVLGRRSRRSRRGSGSRSSTSSCKRVPHFVDGPLAGSPKIDVGRCNNPEASTCAEDRTSRGYAHSRLSFTDGMFCPFCIPTAWRSPPPRQKDSSTIEAYFKIVVDKCSCTIIECNQPIRRVFARVDNLS